VEQDQQEGGGGEKEGGRRFVSGPVEIPDFASALRAEAVARGIPLGGDSEPLAAVPYETELLVKNAGLARFWDLRKLPGALEPFHAAPVPRGYRSTSKRRVISRRGKNLLLLDPAAAPPGYVEGSALEPAHHGELFAFIARRINDLSCRTLGEGLNFVILRESEGKVAVILNFHTLSAGIVRGVKRMATELAESRLPILSLFMFHDPSRSQYYMEANLPDEARDIRRMYGPRHLLLRVGDYRFLFDPTVFSQVNPPILPDLLSTLASAFPAPRVARIVDLYCGYGLLGIALSGAAREVCGIEANAEAVRNAVENAERVGGGCRFRFHRGSITPDTRERLLPIGGGAAGGEVVILDPPRGGTGRGVIAAAAARKPVLVLHLFCNADLIEKELPLWGKNGYGVDRVVPFDMFPGTPNAEIAVFLSPRER